MVTGQPIQGENVSFELLINGVPQDARPQIVDLSTKAEFDKVETKLLGETDVLIQHTPTGWSGTATCNARSKSLDQMIDAYIFNKRNNVPAVLNIVVTTRYHDGSATTHVYPEIELEYEKSAKRATAVEIKIPWRTGKARITL